MPYTHPRRRNADEVAALFCERIRPDDITADGKRAALWLTVKQTTWLHDVSPRDAQGIKRTCGSFQRGGREWAWTLSVRKNGAGVLSIDIGMTEEEAEAARQKAAEDAERDAEGRRKAEILTPLALAITEAENRGDAVAEAAAREALRNKLREFGMYLGD